MYDAYSLTCEGVDSLFIGCLNKKVFSISMNNVFSLICGGTGLFFCHPPLCQS